MTDGVMRTVVAHFKSRDPEGALLSGAQALADLLIGPTRNSAAAPFAPAQADAHVGAPPEQVAAQVAQWQVRRPGSATLGDRPARAARGLAAGARGVRSRGKRRLRAGRAQAVLRAGRRALVRAARARRGDRARRQRRRHRPRPSDRHGLGGRRQPRCSQPEDQRRGPRRSRSLANNGRWDEAAAHALTLVELVECTAFPQRPVEEAWHEAVDRYWGWMLGGTGVGLLGLLFGGRRWNRYRSRTCKCGRPRQLLGPIAEDPYLTASQRTEQNIGAIDYDVWWCATCQDVWINDNVAWFSGFSRCPECRARARKTSTTTLSYATEYSTGLQQVNEKCQSCTFVRTYTRTTAMLPSSSSSSSSDSSSGGGSSSGDGSSGSW